MDSVDILGAILFQIIDSDSEEDNRRIVAKAFEFLKDRRPSLIHPTR
jgi:hypothetical protein